MNKQAAKLKTVSPIKRTKDVWKENEMSSEVEGEIMTQLLCRHLTRPLTTGINTQKP